MSGLEDDGSQAHMNLRRVVGRYPTDPDEGCGAGVEEGPDGGWFCFRRARPGPLLS